MAPSAISPPTQTTRASSATYRSASIRVLYSAGICAVIEWQDWHASVFARAARERKPVLLSITASWCGACHEMDRTTYADPRVAAIVREQFVAVRVDTDRRPDINDRYNLGGWPTTAFLTPAGDLMTGGTFVSADRMPGLLTRVAAAFTEGAARETPRQVESESRPHAPDPDLVEVT